jgi:hypothetical protein
MLIFAKGIASGYPFAGESTVIGAEKIYDFVSAMV